MLGLLVLGGAGAWWLFRDESRRAPVPAPHDDLDLVAALMDANAGEVTPDRLVATPDAVVLARASDRALVAVSTRDGVAKDGRTHLLAHLEAPARGLAYAAGQLWVTTGHEVEVVPIGGGEPRRVAELAKPRALAADERAVYVVDVDPGNSGLTHANAVLRISGDGKDRQSLGRSDGEISDLVVDDANVYWADQLEGSIVAVAKTGGPARPLATDRGLPGSLAASGDALFWVERRSESLWTMAKKGGTPTRLEQDFAGFANLVADARGVFWTNEAAVDGQFSVLKVGPGGESMAVSIAVDEVSALASDGTNLWWARGGAVSKVAPP
jgi:hypothetical protein